MVDGAALEMLCPARDLGFESLTLRHQKASNHAGLLAFSFAKRLEPTDCFSLFSPEHGENFYCAASPKPFNIASAEEILEL